MPDKFSFPGGLQDVEHLKDEWSVKVAEIVDDQLDDCPQFFSPLDADGQVVEHVMRWGAFPKKLTRLHGAARLSAGEDRDQQEEYCEWTGIRDESGKLTRACFTTETGLYYDFLADKDFPALQAVYKAAIGHDVPREELVDSNDAYDPRNAWNLSHGVHMIQQFNTLSAAVILAAQSSVVRTNEQGQIITNTSQLIDCGVVADEDRNSDPLIVTDVNGLARQGGRISLRDPIGLYLHGLQTEGWTTPDEADAATFWTVSRGVSGFGMRAVYETPPDCDYEIGDVEVNGSVLTSPSQIAEHVSVRLTGIARSLGKADPILKPCDQSEIGLESLVGESKFPTRA